MDKGTKWLEENNKLRWMAQKMTALYLMDLGYEIRSLNYILDKNEKSLKLKDKKIFLTEKEIQLIETLTKSDVPVSKESIQKQVWFYSDDVDTHTVETHIYRQRKKISEAFLDKNFIKNKKEGYII